MLNKVTIIGNLGNDPEIRRMASGGAIANFTVATSERWKDKHTGESKEKTEWHRVTAFGKLAEIIERYVRKGLQVYVEGSLQTRKWQDKQGNDRYTTEINAKELKMLGEKTSATSPIRTANQNNVAQPLSQPVPQPNQGFNDDDIPF